MASSLDLDLSRLSLGGSPFQQQHYTGGSTSSGGAGLPPQPSPLPPSSLTPHSQSIGQQQQQQHMSGGLQPHQIMQPPVHSGPPPHVQLQEPQRRRGVVKFFNSLKGFGFVVDNDPAALGGQEVFCHFSAISGKGGFRSLGEGEEVEYELVQGPKGFQAANLTGPGGRTVQGDPKARLQQKPPPYMPFASLAMPLGGPYLADPYHAQHAGVYAGSPYTQHVVYVPATAALPPSQYAYAPVPLAAPRHQPASSASGPSNSGTSPFTAPQYQSYAAPPSNVGSSPNPSAAGNPHAGQYQNVAGSRFGVATGAYGAPQPPAGNDARGGHAGDVHGQQQQQPQQHQSQQQQQPVSSYGNAGNGMPNPAFSPPGGNYPGLAGDTPPSQSGPSFGFAPFSPPSFHHAPLFGAPPPPPSGLHSLSQQAYPPPQQQQSQYQQQPQQQPSYSRHVSSTLPSPPQSSSGSNAVSQSALFGSTSSPAPPSSTAPAPIGSRSGTPSGRSLTPALGNGSIGNDAWKVTPPSTANGGGGKSSSTINGGGQGGVLYASQNGDK